LKPKQIHSERPQFLNSMPKSFHHYKDCCSSTRELIHFSVQKITIIEPIIQHWAATQAIGSERDLVISISYRITALISREQHNQFLNEVKLCQISKAIASYQSSAVLLNLIAFRLFILSHKTYILTRISPK
jgi:NADH:ubiquinone oxidoreductase subunit H